MRFHATRQPIFRLRHVMMPPFVITPLTLMPLRTLLAPLTDIVSPIIDAAILRLLLIFVAASDDAMSLLTSYFF